MMMDLRKEMNEIIEESGHYILLQRKSKKFRCSCWNEKYQSALPNCPKCLGTGMVSRIERHKVRRQTAVMTSGASKLIMQENIGRYVEDMRIFFMKYDAQPKIGDIIMEVGWNGNKPTHLISAFEVAYPDDQRGDKGRVEFYQVGVKEITVDTPIRGFVIRRLGPVQNYEIVQRG
jgi:hypothetical protein